MRTHRGLALAALLLALAPWPAQAAPEAPEHPWCGTRPGQLQEAIALHRAQERLRARDPLAKMDAELAPTATQVGQVAVVSDPTILLQPTGPVDVEGVGIRFVPDKKKGMRVSLVGGELGDDVGERVTLGDDDSLAIKFFQGFRFRFQKKSYTSFFVNSDGNVSFGAGDGRSVDRSLANFASLPRIGALYADLDPSHAGAGGGVFVKLAKDRAVVTWLAVPQYDDPEVPGVPGPNTFQMTLLKDGSITFAYGDLSLAAAVIGAGPGPAGGLTLVDYTQGLPAGPIAGAIAERFGTETLLDDLAISNAFYSGFADVYDNLVVFLDFPFQLLDGQAFAYQFHVKNEVQGIGLNVFDDSAFLGSKAKLRSFAQMGYIGRYSPNPEDPILGVDSSIDIVAHETGHRWLAYVAAPANVGASDILRGRQRAHWSYYFNSEASQLEGTRLRDGGDGTFQSLAESEHYSDLDRYLMGLLPAQAVPHGMFFHVADAQGGNRDDGLSTGEVIRGRRVDVNVEDILAANGPRVPDSSKAQKSFKMAFVLVTLPGQGPSALGLQRVEALRSYWESYFQQATGGLGSVSTTLQRRRGRK